MWVMVVGGQAMSHRRYVWRQSSVSQNVAIEREVPRGSLLPSFLVSVAWWWEVDDCWCLMVTNVLRDLQRKEKMFTPQGTTRERERGVVLLLSVVLMIHSSKAERKRARQENQAALFSERGPREKPESGYLPIVVFVFVSVSSGWQLWTLFPSPKSTMDLRSVSQGPALKAIFFAHLVPVIW